MSRPLPHSIRPALGYLVGRLASPRDAEALGAARAIGRQLAAVGCGFSDLADVVEGAPAPAPESARRTAPPSRPRSRRAEEWRPPVYVQLDAERRSALLGQLADALADPRLKGWQRVDLAQLVDRLEWSDRPPTLRMVQRARGTLAELQGEPA